MPWDSTNGLIFRPQLLDLLPAEVRQLAGPPCSAWKPDLSRAQAPALPGHSPGWSRWQPAARFGRFGTRGRHDRFRGHGLWPADRRPGGHCRYFAEGAEVPVAVAAALCQGFHSVIPLSAGETDLLLDLMIARQILTLQLNEFRRCHMEHPPEFISVDNPRVLASLKVLAALDNREFGQQLREACA